MRRFFVILYAYAELSFSKLLFHCLIFLFKIPGTLHKMVSNKLMALQKGQDPSKITGNSLN